MKLVAPPSGARGVTVVPWGPSSEIANSVGQGIPSDGMGLHAPLTRTQKRKTQTADRAQTETAQSGPSRRLRDALPAEHTRHSGTVTTVEHEIR